MQGQMAGQTQGQSKPTARALGGHGTASGASVRVGSLGGLAAAGVGLSPRPWGACRERSRVLASAGPMWEQCGLYPRQPGRLDSLSSPAGPAAPTWRRGPAAWPRGGLAPGRAWAGPDSRRPPRPAAEWPEAPASSRRSPSASPPACGGFGGLATRLCHVCHPAGTHEHLSKIPGGRGRAAEAASGPPSPGSQCQMRAGDKSSIFLVLLGWQPGLPQRHLAPGRPASGCRGGRGPGHASQDRGTEGPRWPETSTPEGLLDRGWHLGTACWPAGPPSAACRCDRLGKGTPFHLLASETAPRPPAPSVSHLFPSLLLETSRGLCHLVLAACYVSFL